MSNIEFSRIIELFLYAKFKSNILKEAKDPNSYILAELGIGLNRKSSLTGSMLEDEGAYGTIHFGWGNNFDQGGKNKASTHIDTVIKSPTVIIDGKVFMRKGKLAEKNSMTVDYNEMGTS